jgi:hypothetical protein
MSSAAGSSLWAVLTCLCTTCLMATVQDCRQEDRRWMSRLGRVMFLVERTRRTRPNDVAAVTEHTADQVRELSLVRACHSAAIQHRRFSTAKSQSLWLRIKSMVGSVQEREPPRFEDLLCGRVPHRPDIAAILQQHKRQKVGGMSP